MHCAFFVSILSLIACAGLCSAIVGRHHRSFVNICLLVNMSWLGLWAFSDILLYFHFSFGNEVPLLKLNAVFGITAGGFFFNTLIFLLLRRRPQLVFWLLLAISMICVFLTCVTDLVIRGFVRHADLVLPAWGPLYLPIVVFIVISMSYGLLVNLHAVFKTPKPKAPSISIINLSSAGIAVFLFVVCQALLPAFADLPETVRLSSSTPLVFFLGLHYAMTKYKFLSVSLEKEAKELFEDVFAGILLLDRHEKVTQINRTACRIFGVAPEAAEGILFADLCAEETISSSDGESEITLRDNGAKKVLSLTRSKILRYGVETGTLVLLRDVTAQKNLEEILSRSRNQLEEEALKRTEQLKKAQNAEDLGAFAGGIAHDFNNLLHAMMAFASLARDDLPPNSVIRRDLEEVLIAATRAQKVVRQILDFSRGSEDYYKELVVIDVVKEALALVKTSLPSNVDIELLDHTHGAYILGDRTQINQLIMNLCTNAYQSMSKGGHLTVFVSVFELRDSFLNSHTSLYPGKHVCIEVRDTGDGIEPDLLEIIFEPFFTTRKVEDSIGLGLSIVEGIARNHGGAVTVESEPQQGSAFRVYIPKWETEPEDGESQTEASSAGGEKILFVADEKQPVRVSERLFGKLKWSFHSISNSLEALLLFRDDPQKWSLVIIDQSLPNMTGIQLAKEMLELRGDTVIVLLVDSEDILFLNEAKAAGVFQAITKPLSSHKLSSLVDQLLMHRKLDEAK